MFEQAKLKVSWARHMIGEIERGVTNFAASQTCTIRSQHNREDGSLVVQFRGRPAPPPADVVMIAGTVVQTLRSSLDYITSEVWNEAKETDTRVHFPIDVDQEQLKRSGSFKKIERFRPELANFIADEIKPTKADNFSIWATNRLANTDKHRNLLLVAHWQGFEIDKIKRTDGVEMANVRFNAPASGDDKGVIQIPNVEEYTDPQGVITVSLREPDIIQPEVFNRYEIVSTLLGLREAVAQAIDRTEKFLGS